MRECPKCNKPAVIEHGYCGHCREFTLAPLANRRTPDNQRRWPHWWRQTATWLVCGALLDSPLAAHAPPMPNPTKGDPQCLECVVALFVICVGVIAYHGAYCDDGDMSLPPLPRPPLSYARKLSGFSTNSTWIVLGPRQFTLLCNIAPDGSLSLEVPVMEQWLTAMPTNAAPVDVGWTNGVLSITEPGWSSRTIVLERSTDLQTWMPIATNVWSSRFEQVSEVDLDAPEGMAFYRVH